MRGGVAAALLAGAGYDVVVCDKGPYVPPAGRTNLEADMIDRTYEGHGLVATDDGNVLVLAGSCLGGGSAVNWGCCLDPPMEVRVEWADRHGLEHLRPRPSPEERGGGEAARAHAHAHAHVRPPAKEAGELDGAIASVRERIGVREGSDVGHNAMNRVLSRGCDGLGYRWAVTGQNYRDPAGPVEAGFTCFSDRYDNKRSGLVTYLADAARSGARIVPDFAVERVLREDTGGKGRRTRPRATGVVGRTGGDGGGRGGRRVEIRARRCVVMSAGSLNTPCVLLRSGLSNRHIGRHLRLHPVTFAVGLFSPDAAVQSRPTGAEGVGHLRTASGLAGNVLSLISEAIGIGKDGEKEGGGSAPTQGSIKSWLGAPMTTICTEFTQGPDKDGYGARIECPSAHPGLMAAGLPWRDPKQFKGMLSKAGDASFLIVLQRDKSEGRVVPDADGRPRISYRLNEADKRSMLQSLAGAVRILAKAGAHRILTAHTADPGVENKEGLDDETVEAYIGDVMERKMPKHSASVFSAHQMGSCRIGSSPSTSAADEDGELWECDGLYVADASTLPTASGSNPMISTLAMAHVISNRLATRLQYEDGKLDGDENALFRAMHLSARREERRKAKGRLATAASLLLSPSVLFVVSACTAMLALRTGLEDMSEVIRVWGS